MNDIQFNMLNFMTPKFLVHSDCHFSTESVHDDKLIWKHIGKVLLMYEYRNLNSNTLTLQTLQQRHSLNIENKHSVTISITTIAFETTVLIFMKCPLETVPQKVYCIAIPVENLLISKQE